MNNPTWHAPPRLTWSEIPFGAPDAATLYRDCWSMRRIALFHGRSYQSVRNELLAAGVEPRARVTRGLRPMLETTKAKFRERMATEANPSRGKHGAAHPNYGKQVHSEAWRENLRQRMLAFRHTPESRAKIAEAATRWHRENGPVLATPDAARRWAQANNVRPNRQEVRLGELLDSCLPGRYICNVLGDTVVDGKIPDFVSSDGTCLIELYGDYWHRGEDPQNRIDLFAAFGYRTLVVWERELRAPATLTARLTEFDGRGTSATR